MRQERVNRTSRAHRRGDGVKIPTGFPTRIVSAGNGARERVRSARPVDDEASLSFGMHHPPLLQRLHDTDRALFARFALAEDAPWAAKRFWVGFTHLGGATAVIFAVLVPLLFAEGHTHQAAVLGAWSLLVSHLLVQVVKRNAVRSRPAPAREGRTPVGAPDRFSFPSGHSCSAMAVGFAYAMSWHAYATPLLVLAVVIGMSRVRLGLHYPSDVVAGQAIAIATVLGFWLVL